MTPEQVCAVLGITGEDLAGLMLSGELPVIGGRSGIRVSEPALEEYISRGLPCQVTP